MIFRNDFYFLSNMYPCVIRYNGLLYRCSEAAYQAQKTVNIKERIKFTNLDGYEAKKLGRELKNIRNDWDHIKVNIMEDILISKFKQHPGLKEKLLNILDEELIEENTWCDNFWGQCNCPLCKDKEKKNMLGKLLAKIKNKI